MWKRLVKVGYRIVMIWGLTFLWSRVYRFLYHRKFRGVHVPVLLSYTEAQRDADLLTWKPDQSRELWDAVGDPRYVEHIFQETKRTGTQPDGALDCDEFAVWVSARLDSYAYRVGVLSVSWMDGLKVSGHNVSLVSSTPTQVDPFFYHLGNWGLRGPFNSLRAVIHDILDHGGHEVSEFVGWCVFDPWSLKVYSGGTSIPSSVLVPPPFN